MRITLRIPDELGAKVALRAKENCRSVNSQIVVDLQVLTELGERIKLTKEALDIEQHLIDSGTQLVTRAISVVDHARDLTTPSISSKPKHKVVVEVLEKAQVVKKEPSPRPPAGSKWSVQGWRYYLERFGAEPSEAEWELYQNNRM